MEKLLEILKEIKPEIDFSKEENLIEREILTSFDIIRLVSELNNEYDIEISPLYIVPENFKSAQAILDLVTKIQDED
ncbi:MAG: acyl carrier protein [Clostridia bacterium]|nr:acyl carrier protein [Clostridia bacterium]